MDAAHAAGAIDVGMTELTAAVADAELVMLCTPVARIAPMAAEIAPLLPKGCVVTDVGSTKSSIVRAIEKVMPGFVGSHPMTGSEKSGVGAARADLFVNATCVMTPTPLTDSNAERLVDFFWTTVGGRVVKASPEAHDRLVALVSHLPHAAAAALVATQTDESRALAGPGYRDTTRVAAGDPVLWRDILIDNSAGVIEALEAFEERLTALKRALATKDAAAVDAFLRRGAGRS